MRPPSYRQRLFVEHDLGESSGSAVDAVRAELGIHGLRAEAVTCLEKSEEHWFKQPETV